MNRGAFPSPVSKGLFFNLSLWILPAFREPCVVLKDLEQWQGGRAMRRENAVKRISNQCGSEMGIVCGSVVAVLT
ncbi:hypothetical protein TNIN_283911 [Trichonephila inaurata madagascariensis]|uniref:Uncharacterized protein n=1 Tax=Trichonephila inaurata madagascariensis TaxID=2747483 RepID=A0A8X6YK03_9ARAC|nr:hypothetical protein TNIN_283911 [Trichonephila inaurata madagascariensis]